MSNESKWQEKVLSSDNPFSGTIVRSVWDDSPDVESINKHLTDQVTSLLKDAMKSHYTRVLLVLGQAGIGKTHFISRLRRIADKGDFLFVAVKPISDVTSIFKHIYRETFTSLRKKSPNSAYSPMESLISHIVVKTLLSELKAIEQKRTLPRKIKKLITQLEKDHTLIFKMIESDPSSVSFFNSFIDRTIHSIEENHPEVDLIFLKVLFKVLNPKLRAHAIHWLQGDDISDEELSVLDVRYTINNDQIAQRILYSIMTLSDRPILYCFDQLESIYDRFGDQNVLLAFFDTVVRLCNETPNALILLMALSSSWNDQIEPLLQASAKDRIEYRESLQTLSPEQVQELVEKRLDSLWGIYPYPPKPSTYPFSKNYLNQVGENEGWNPRGLIRTLAHDIKLMKENNKVFLLEKPEIGEVIGPSTPFSSFIKNQMAIFISKYSDDFDTNPYSTRENYLEAGLFDLFKGCKDLDQPIGGYRVTNVYFKTKPKELDMIVHFLNEKGSAEKWGIEICNGENNATVRAVLNRIKSHLDFKKVDRWLIIRDSGLRIRSSWKKTKEQIETLKKWGKFHFVDNIANIEIFAYKELLDLSSSGDLEHNNEIITRKNLNPFLVQNILPTLSIIKSVFNLPDGNGTPPPPKSDLQTLILEKAQTTMLLHMQKIFSDFTDKETAYRNAIDELIDKNKVFIMTEEKNQLVISLAPEEDYF